MSLLNSATGQINSAQNFIKNPFEEKVGTDFRKPDFSEGFLIQEIIDGKEAEKIVLLGNQMPKIPFSFGGSQRVKKEFYNGHSEPVMQVLGSEEKDVKINGTLKDKRYKDPSLYGVATELQVMIDSFRIRGNLVKLKLGEWVRYAIMTETKFDMDNLGRLNYEITFSIIGFNPPRNAKFISSTKEVPRVANKKLISKATELQKSYSNIPKTVPRSIADEINGAISTVSGVIATVTGFVDSIVSTVQDIQKSIQRALGLIKYAQGKLNSYKKLVGAYSPFSTTGTLTGRYENAKFYNSQIALSASLTALLGELRDRLKNLIDNTPLVRHLVITGDNLQKIAVKYYGSSENWKKIYDFNNLSSTDLTIGSKIEIPRL